jgi:hypothetical protein
MTILVSNDSREGREFMDTKFILIGQVLDKLIKFETFFRFAIHFAFCDSNLARAQARNKDKRR